MGLLYFNENNEYGICSAPVVQELGVAGVRKLMEKRGIISFCSLIQDS